MVVIRLWTEKKNLVYSLSGSVGTSKARDNKVELCFHSTNFSKGWGQLGNTTFTKSTSSSFHSTNFPSEKGHLLLKLLSGLVSRGGFARLTHIGITTETDGRLMGRRAAGKILLRGR